MKNARLFGILFGILGLCLSWFYLSTINEIGATFRFLLIGPVLVGLGLGMLILPGYTLTDEEWAVKEDRLKLIFGKTSMGIKIFWFALGALGFLLTYFGVFDSFFA